MTGTRRGRALVLALAALGAGCAPNAVFELQIELPAAPDGEAWYAQVQIREQEGWPLALPWMGGDLSATELGPTSQWDCISIITQDPSKSLHVRVRFCRTPSCLSLEDGAPPERAYSIETPFYVGQRTYLRVEIPRIPLCESTADCAVGICVAGECGCDVDRDCASEGLSYRCEPQAGCVQAVDRCSVEGCIDGVSSRFCASETGEHFCESNGLGFENDPREAAWTCH